MAKSKWLEENRTKKIIKKFISQKLIPLDVNVPEQLGHNKEYYIKFLEILGFKNIKILSNFIKADFPKGWKYKIYKETFPFFYLLDNKFRKRASVYISTAEFLGMEEGEEEFSNNKTQYIAFINWMPRYVYHIRGEKNYAYGEVFDNNTEEVLYKTKPRLISSNDNKTIDYHLDKKNLYNSLEEECKMFLNFNYPKYNNILEYWENKNYIYEDEKKN